MLKIDAHQHFWKLDRGDYGWLTPELATLYHDFLPDDLIPILQSAGVDGTVVVQAAPTIEETTYLLELANQYREIKGVVGWVDFERSSVLNDIEELTQHWAFKGLRPMIQDLPDDDWMLNPAFNSVFKKMTQHQLTFDALVYPKHLKYLHQLLLSHPTLTTVIDHAAKPDIANHNIDDWKFDITRIARDTNAYCKLSGLTTEAGPHWQLEDLIPYIDVLLETFGADRLIWGSDWPVCQLATNYLQWLEICQQLLPVSEKDRAKIFGENAVKAYRLSP